MFKLPYLKEYTTISMVLPPTHRRADDYGASGVVKHPREGRDKYYMFYRWVNF